jgi:hypothetical protein
MTTHHLTHIAPDRPIHHDQQAITIEQYHKRRALRRRRVAKRLVQRVPLFAVEEMQTEFPGYTYADFEADILRKTRKGKSFRRPKPKGFDWKQISQEIPDFFAKCIQRRKTRAVLRGRTKDGTQFHCIVRSVWCGDYGECRLRTSELITLWRGPLHAFVKHPAILLQEYQNEL